ncbi:MAG TPA: hypothetical protein PKZ75_08770 [Bacteroidia bacterium]|nr:hypothetical protein [Bacteroidia bacterium]
MTTNEVVGILTAYRDRLKAQYEKPGWNKWALFGAFASLVWLLINIRSENNLETVDSFKLLIVLILSETLFHQIQAAINLSSKTKTKYIEFKKELPNRYLSLAFQFIIYSLILIYSHNFINFPFKNCDIIYFGFLYFVTVITILIPLISKIGFPFPQGKIAVKEAKWFKNLFLIIIIFLTTCSIYFLLCIINNWKIYSMWSSSFIFFGFYFVLSKLIETIQKNPLIDEIDYLIDDVVFNKMTPEAAINNLKLIVIGLEFKDAISPLLIEYFEIEKNVREKINYINQIAIKTSEENDEIKRKALIDGLNSNINYFINNEYLQLTKFTKKVSLRLTIYQSFDHDTNEMKQTIEQINTSIKDLETQIQIAKIAINKLNN